MKNFIKKHNIKIIFIVIILVQILTIVYAASERVLLHIDEYLSFGFISSENMYVHGKPDFYDTWHPNKYYSEYLEVNESEQSNFAPVYDNQKNDVHPPLYYLLLRIFCNFNIDNFSIWPAIALNIVLYIISICIVYLIGQKLFNNKKYSLLLALFVGFNIGVIQIAIFIRMYQLLILASLILLYWHLCKKDKEKLGFKDFVQLISIVCLGFLSHYYFAILTVGFCISYFIKGIKRKRYKEVIKYISSMVLAVCICTVIFPCWIEHFILSGRGTETVGNFSTRIENFWPYLSIALKFYLNVINNNIFNGIFYTLLSVLGVLALFNICLWIKNKLKSKEELNVPVQYGGFDKKDSGSIKKEDMGISYIIIPMLFYFVFIMFLAPYVEIRYLAPIIIFILILMVYYLKFFIQKIFKNGKNIFILVSLICTFTTLVSIEKIDDNTFTYKGDKQAMEKIVTSKNRSLIYIKNVNTAEFYNSYEVLLNYENTRFVKYDDNIMQMIKAIIEDKNLSGQEYMIGIDASLHQEFMNKLSGTEGFGDLEFSFRLGANFFYALPNLPKGTDFFGKFSD